MAKWLDIKGPVVADTVYADSTLVAKDVAFTLPGIEFLTADVQAMGNMTVPLIGLLENMELSITKIGVDNGLRRMNPHQKAELRVPLGSECRKIRRIHRNRRLQGFCAYYAGIIP